MKSLFTTGSGQPAALTFFEGERCFGQPLELRRVQPHRAVLFHLRHQFVRDVVEREHFFFADAEQDCCRKPRLVMIAFAARFMHAVSSTSTGGLPGPAQMARLPVCIAAFTTPGPPVTQQQSHQLRARRSP